MNIPQIQLQITNAQLGLTIQEPQQKLKQRPADMTIEQPAAEVSIHTTPGKLEMDSTQLRADVGMYTFTEFARKAAEKGVQDVLQGIARRVNDGNQIGDIVNGTTIGSIERSKRKLDYSVGMTYIPSFNATKIQYTPAKVDVQVQTNKPKINVQMNKPQHTYTPGKVDVALTQKPSVQIDWKI